jgi:hypothetical protein
MKKIEDLEERRLLLQVIAEARAFCGPDLRKPRTPGREKCISIQRPRPCRLNGHEFPWTDLKPKDTSNEIEDGKKECPTVLRQRAYYFL